MSTDIEKAMELAADAAAGAMSSLKRKLEADHSAGEREAKIFKADSPPQTAPQQTAPPQTAPPQTAPPQTAVPEVHIKTFAPSAAQVKSDAEAGAVKKPTSTRAREVRLDQNRKAARESRRRKKVMIEELQRSVIFFSRANGTLKQQNDELSRLLMQAQAHVSAIGTEENNAVAVQQQPVKQEPERQISAEQAQAQAVATQAMFESQGFPAAAARAAAQTMNACASVAAMSPPKPQAHHQLHPSQVSIPTMTPGATMQAMANFQQAAAQAMQAAMQGMQGIPGVNMSQLAATPAGANAQQAYTDTMTALAMQQAAAAAGHQFMMQPAMQGLFPFPIMAWPQAQVQQLQQLGNNPTDGANK